VSEAAAIPHCDLLVFFLLPKMSLLVIGAVRGFGIVTPVVSVSAETSIAEAWAKRVGLVSWLCT
jgi:hypothetical protein